MPLLDPPTNPELASMGSHSLPDDQRPAPVRQARRPRRGFPHLLWALLAGLVVCAVVATVFILRDAADPSHTPAGAPVVASTPAAAPPIADLPEGAFIGDGGAYGPQVYVVGEHIRAGTYTTPGALDPKTPPHWKQSRLRSEGDVPRRVTGREGVGPQTVTLEVGDIFETAGYQPWAPSSEDK